MWFLRWLFILAVLITAMAFGFANSEQRVIIYFLGYSSETRLIMALFSAFVVGVIVWFPFAIVQYFQNKAEANRLRRENSQLQKELNELRNMSIEEGETKK